MNAYFGIVGNTLFPPPDQRERTASFPRIDARIQEGWSSVALLLSFVRRWGHAEGGTHARKQARPQPNCRAPAEL